MNSSLRSSLYAVLLLIIGIGIHSCTSRAKIDAPIAYIQTQGTPVKYTTYQIRENLITKSTEVEGKKNTVSQPLSPEEFKALVEVLRKNRFLFLKEGFKKNKTTDAVRIITHLPDMKASKSDAGGIFREDRAAWDRIEKAFQDLFTSKNL